MSKKSIIPEFNSQILDTIINTHALPDQEADEFTIGDLRRRGWSRDSARSIIERALIRGEFTRRMGRAASNGRPSWLYRKKGK